MRLGNKLAGILTLAAFALPSAAWAGTCEDTFVKKGNFISGLRFTATTSVADMPPEVAINQLRGIVARRGYDIIAAEPAAGALLIEQSVSQNVRAFPIEINATATGGIGTVVMQAKLRAGQNTKEDAAKAEMCAVLAELKGGKAGRQAAAAGSSAVTQQAAPIAMTAQAFASQISKDAERNVAAIPVRYQNKQFTLSGTVDYLRPDGNTTRVAFKIMQAHEMVLRLPGMPATISEVSCLMAPGTSVYTMQLKPGKSIKLTGTFHEYSDIRDVTWFKDCRPAAGK
jgi:hypothetical protein